ncbi:Cu2+-exporting ATPase/copper chaperone [Methanobrevibacter gottschalkii]|uniref:Copper chaperone n=2 Tax=Methanobrevibacter gottschalkii TaxID=190974 RepID=A0A3N5B5N3_9EURY|nr:MULTISPECIES: heavy-metal-associated domain-containing protein [Methanobrevibacter]MCQ2970081.1 heavy-metal-associated domain-containing protein [archaeon]OEC95038.1 copper-binding protein [Methanobrevibacter sp. A27]RPF52567.1 copper chaperone [Methanobrevibacter gottschalkii DSM 11977]SEK34032.1 Cu2+-exporting ATPase/copper chaperone [Methanobrevibacter gottschalkii]
MAEKEIKVVGMHCSSCVNAVELCLKDVDGIDDAKADLDSGITTLTLSGNVSDEDINEAVKEAGFEVE